MSKRPENEERESERRKECFPPHCAREVRMRRAESRHLHGRRTFCWRARARLSFAAHRADHRSGRLLRSFPRRQFREKSRSEGNRNLAAEIKRRYPEPSQTNGLAGAAAADKIWPRKAAAFRAQSRSRRCIQRESESRRLQKERERCKQSPASGAHFPCAPFMQTFLSYPK